jgi:predicted DsbA family dithiol-disulfide isomerase
LQHEAKERLLSAYFVEGRYVGRPEDLADLAAEIGLDREDALRSLVEDEYRGAVEADQRLAAQYGINAVPFFVVDGQYGLSGAQPAEAFPRVLAKVVAERADDAAA